jgi:putative oxidoreductase
MSKPATGTFSDWIVSNRERVWDSARIYLGFALFVKGFSYMLHLQALSDMMVEVQVPLAGGGLAELVAVSHVAGGLLIAFGLLTRVGALIQIPSLLGAIVFVHAKEGLFTSAQTLEFSVLVLFLLGVTAVVGAGPLSIDFFFSSALERGERQRGVGAHGGSPGAVDAV